MVTSADQTDVCVELALTSSQIIDATAPLDLHGYGGKRCESRVGIISGRLCIYASYGTELPDRDSGLFAGHSDPYVRVVAYRSRGSSKSLQTSQRINDGSPEWNQWLDFGVDRWTRFTVQVYNEDGSYT